MLLILLYESNNNIYYYLIKSRKRKKKSTKYLYFYFQYYSLASNCNRNKIRSRVKKLHIVVINNERYEKSRFCGTQSMINDDIFGIIAYTIEISLRITYIIFSQRVINEKIPTSSSYIRPIWRSFDDDEREIDIKKGWWSGWWRRRWRLMVFLFYYNFEWTHANAGSVGVWRYDVIRTLKTTSYPA